MRILSLVISMVFILGSLVAEALGAIDPLTRAALHYVRWVSVALLLSAAMVLYLGARSAEFTRGANHNASGVAALLELGRRLSAKPLESTEVWLVVTGCKESWLSGMRALFRGLDVDKRSTYFLNLSGVGAGSLRYVTKEGMLHLFNSDRELLQRAEDVAQQFRAGPLVYRGLPTDAFVALARGYRTMGVMGFPEEGESEPKG